MMGQMKNETRHELRADLSKCLFNLYEVFSVTFYQSVTDIIDPFVILF